MINLISIVCIIAHVGYTEGIRSSPAGHLLLQKVAQRRMAHVVANGTGRRNLNFNEELYNKPNYLGFAPSEYSYWRDSKCYDNDGFSYCNVDGWGDVCLPNWFDGFHVPCGVEENDRVELPRVVKGPRAWMQALNFKRYPRLVRTSINHTHYVLYYKDSDLTHGSTAAQIYVECDRIVHLHMLGCQKKIEDGSKTRDECIFLYERFWRQCCFDSGNHILFPKHALVEHHIGPISKWYNKLNYDGIAIHMRGMLNPPNYVPQGSNYHVRQNLPRMFHQICNAHTGVAQVYAAKVGSKYMEPRGVDFNKEGVPAIPALWDEYVKQEYTGN